ncbi:MAG: hypothetical protein KDB37_11205 [Ilumatobacter sp.]|nr:hypothetical protein [Ilumatobacter sp.]
MPLDKHTLNLAAAALSTLAAVIGLGSALFGKNKGSGGVLPALIGLAGSAAWLGSALDDMPSDDLDVA